MQQLLIKNSCKNHTVRVLTYITADTNVTWYTLTKVSVDLVRTISVYTGRIFTLVYICRWKSKLKTTGYDDKIFNKNLLNEFEAEYSANYIALFFLFSCTCSLFLKYCAKTTKLANKL